jgi:hypothetical protein
MAVQSYEVMCDNVHVTKRCNVEILHKNISVSYIIINL